MKDKHYVVEHVEDCLKLIVLEVVLGLLISSEDLQYSLGFLSGGLFSILIFIITFINIRAYVNKDFKRARTSAVLGYYGRFLLTGIFLVLMTRIDAINFYTSAVGLFNIKIVIYFRNLLSLFKK